MVSILTLPAKARSIVCTIVRKYGAMRIVFCAWPNTHLVEQPIELHGCIEPGDATAAVSRLARCLPLRELVQIQPRQVIHDAVVQFLESLIALAQLLILRGQQPLERLYSFRGTRSSSPLQFLQHHRCHPLQPAPPHIAATRYRG